jgi:molybdenum cofactor cytidylyltransferase
MTGVAALVLAAGRSRRMGFQKLLLPIAGRPLVARLVDELLRTPVSPVVVVTGADEAEIAAALAGRDHARVRNPDPDGDMLSSVRCGFRALPSDCFAVLVVPGDSPGTRAPLVRQLVEAHLRTGRSIVVPVHAGRRGHPLLVAMKHRHAILERYDGLGLRGLLRDHPDEIDEVPVDSPDVLANLNRPEDLARWKATSETTSIDP